MKRFILPLVALFVVMIALVSWKSTVTAAGGAVVIKDGACTVIDGDGNLAYANTFHSVLTPSGNRIAKCHVSDVFNPTGKTLHYNFENTGGYIFCNTEFGFTNDWQQTLTPSGQATITCFLK